MIRQVVVVTKLNPKDLREKTRPIHRQTLKAVLCFLISQGVRYRVYDRRQLKRALTAGLIVTVGGDGTALAASHFARRSPLFCINSAPATSTGFFCRVTLKDFSRRLKKILNGKIKPTSLPRLAVYLNGKKLKPHSLNEVLFASKHQGETARYTLQIGKRKEVHKSSGVWVATGAGSTAAVYSAGGKKDSPTAGRIQYRVREACRFPKNRYRLLHGFVRPGEKVCIRSEINQGMVFIDGAKWRYPVPRKGVIAVRGNVAPLKIFL